MLTTGFQASGTTVALDALAWPLARADEGLCCLAQARGWLAVDDEARPRTPHTIAEEGLNRRIEQSAQRIGLETEAIHATYRETEALVRDAGPALLRLPDTGQGQRLLFMVRSDRRWAYLVALDHSVQRVRRHNVADALWADFAASYVAQIEPLLAHVGAGEQRRARTERALLAEIIGPGAQCSGWLLRLPPGAPLQRQMSEARLKPTLALLLVGFAAQLLLTVSAWWLIGRDALRGEFSWSWLWAWVLVLLTTIPFELLTTFSQRQLVTRIGTIFKVRLLAGALQLQPHEIRHQGAGQFMGRALAADLVEQLALAGGFVAVFSVLQLAVAALILTTGAGGLPSAILLCVWSLLVIVFGWRYGGTSDAYAAAHRTMTSDLVERMVGHRTRLVQEDPVRWHDDEDAILNRYVRMETREDKSEARLAMLPRGWIVVGLAWFVYLLIVEQPDAAHLAITLGGILLAFQALSSMTSGMQSLFDVRNAWREVQMLFAAAARPVDVGSEADLDTQIWSKRKATKPGAAGSTPPLLSAVAVDFRYPDRAQNTLRQCHLRIDAGERVLLTGPSGGGKSTLAGLLAGLRPLDIGSITLWGHDQRTLGTAEWRRHVVIVPQFHENYILNGTLAFNLLLGRRWPPAPADLIDAESICRELGLGSLVDRMPAGLQQMVGESGWRLSHGECSRIYVGRALLQRPALLILDESFGALDAGSLQMAMHAVHRHADTLLVIAHP